LGGLEAFVSDEIGGRWGSAITVGGPPDLHLNSNSGISSLSCRATSACTALGYSIYHASGEKLFVVNEVGGRWTQARALRDPPNKVFVGFAGSTISCGSPRNCAVGGSYSTISSEGGAFVDDEVDGKWANPIDVPGIEKMSYGGIYVQAISCGGADSCAAVGGYTGDSQNLAFFASTRGALGDQLT
jgi:hypothetical protein